MFRKRALKRRLSDLIERQRSDRRELGARAVDMYREGQLDTDELEKQAESLRELDSEIASLREQVEGEGPREETGENAVDGADGDSGEWPVTDTGELEAAGASGPSPEDAGRADSPGDRSEHLAATASSGAAEPDTGESDGMESSAALENGERGKTADERPSTPSDRPAAAAEASVSTGGLTGQDAGASKPSTLDELAAEIERAEREVAAHGSTQVADGEVAGDEAADELAALESALEGELARERERTREAFAAIQAELESAERRARAAEQRAEAAERNLADTEARLRTAAAQWLRGQALAMRREIEREGKP